MSNKAAGTKFEREFAIALADGWFWVHLFQDNKIYQPCDVIACRNGNTYLFDCKDCKSGRFQLERLEENQFNAMQLFEMAGNRSGRIAIRFPGGEIYLVNYGIIDSLRRQGIKSLDLEGCRLHGERFDAWISRRDEEDGWSEKHEDRDWK